ncbi:hypothetical protein QBC34DRAFT_385099 [Podospora aff. communis PSN243]|uniref:Fungal N-terminal domain-containing protein n=1 Tax=Podospora aff. communis PSN243 TaxID=3040156 RepID=A0AAV9G6Z6_9PEZI|nr:hypothetical protein QBC34DRAFT_385099 [Podospora aff. communis PSN243]
MDFSPTFGSIGDFIAICQLACELVHILGLGRGGSSSGADYKRLRMELDHFVEFLKQINDFWNNVEDDANLFSLKKLSQDVVEDSSRQVAVALGRFQRKYNNLSATGPPETLKDLTKRLEWAIREKARVKSLRKMIRTTTDTLHPEISLYTAHKMRLLRRATPTFTDKITPVGSATDEGTVTPTRDPLWDNYETGFSRGGQLLFELRNMCPWIAR